MTDATRVRQNQRIACRIYDGLAEVITLDTPLRQHRLNQVGTRIWQLAEPGLPVAEIAAALCTEFAVDADRARDDTLQFCALLVERGILLADAGGDGGERL